MMMLCRICLKRSRDLLNLFDFMDLERCLLLDNFQDPVNSSSFRSTKMVTIIEQHFWFKLQPNDEISRCICKKCWRKIEQFHDFYESIRQAQENFIILKDSMLGQDDQLMMDENEEDNDDDDAHDDNDDHIDIKKEPTDIDCYEIDEIEAAAGEAFNSLENQDDQDQDEDNDHHLDLVTNPTKDHNELEIGNFQQNPLIEHEIDLSLCKAEILHEGRSRLEMESENDDNDDDDDDEDNILLKDLLLSSIQEHTIKGRKLREQKNTEIKDEERGRVICRRMQRLHNKSMKRKHSTEEKETILSMESMESNSKSLTNLILNPERKRKKPRVKYDPEFIGNLIKKHIQMTCNLCTFVGEIFSDIIQHFNEQHPNEKPYIMCCKRKLNKPYQITQHALKHENPDYFRCHECEKSFVDDSGLRAHRMYQHAAEEEKIHACEFCSQRFARKLLLELHKGTHIPQEERTIVCDQCPTKKTFATEYLLQIHNSMRHKREANVCHVCAKRIRDKRCFEKHVRQHSESNSLRMKCTYPGCDSWLKDEDTLKQHMRRHNPDQKSYDCPDCGKFCKNRRALTNHKRSSHSTQTYKCDECGKTFKKALSLKEHLARHTGEALYKCPFCTRTFNSNANMHSHKKKMHPMEWAEWRKYQRGSAQILNCNANTGSDNSLTTMQTFYGHKMMNLLPKTTPVVQENDLQDESKK